VKDAIKIRTVKKTWFLHRDTTWSLEIVGQSGRILPLCNLYRRPYRGGGYYYESDRFSFRSDTLAGWRDHVRLKLHELAYEFVQAERCAVCVDKAADGMDCMAECWARFGNYDPKERIRIRLKG
jgi:hypothetical protein